MRWLLAAVCLAAPAAVSAQITTCHANNCLRAIRATNTPSRVLDCSSYFLTAITAAASTVTNTVTTSFTDSTTVAVTETSTESRTATVYATLTISVTTSITTTVTSRPPEATAKAKRGLTVVPSVIPAYASPCSDAVDYSSACSCVGATQGATTIEVPPTTTTETVSETTTVTSTAFDTTVVVTTVATITSITATTTTTVTEAIATETVVAFLLQLQNIYPGSYLKFTAYPAINIIPSPIFIVADADRSKASPLILTRDGYLYGLDRVPIKITDPYPQYVYYPTAFSYVYHWDAKGEIEYALRCSFDADYVISCSSGYQSVLTIFAFGISPEYALALVSANLYLGSNLVLGPAILKAVPIV
ncbi:hypothetical protein DRE_01555 [Drechslerella stenobrocha 248]|uniref:Uncharacterized protein n=1 Tax=Drechslerella stenobrocha 248 TaxID=1043628 RepID=W7HUZ9_9PEZI|nr:hypothetical protein DRE_01555 [Drechslerella stenobrocha 248]